MKILLVNKFHFIKGGSERYYFALAEVFKSLGHDVVFFSMDDEKNFPCDQSKYFVSHVNKNGSFFEKMKFIKRINYSREAFKKMTLLLNDEKPDLVILNLIHKQISCSVIDAIKKYNKKVPIFWTMHELSCLCPAYTMLDGNGNICEKCLYGDYKNCLKNKCMHGSRLMSYLSYREAKSIQKHNWYKLIDLYICPSEFYKNIFLRSKRITSKIVCMRNLLPLSTKYELCDYSNEYVLYLGRLSKEKGIFKLISATHNIGKKLIIVGTGPLFADLQRTVKDNYLNVELVGFKSGDELNSYIKNAKCVVLPSEWYENGPYSAMEAMSMGKPLIVSNMGGLPELVVHGKNGFIFNNDFELQEYLKKIFELNKLNYSEMCKNSLLMAKEMFNPYNYAHKIIDEYNLFCNN